MAIYSLLLSVALPLSGALAHNNGLALTPQMGWNTWNHFGCDISEDTILSAAKAFISYGLPDHGYECECERFSTGRSPLIHTCKTFSWTTVSTDEVDPVARHINTVH